MSLRATERLVVVSRLAWLVLALGSACSTAHQDLGGDRARDGGTGTLLATASATGYAHSCAVAAGGALWCWGASSFGQLGIDPRDAGTCEGVACEGVPHEVPGITGARSVAAGGDQTCALLEDGRVRCFGANQFGQLGRGTADTLDHATPATVELDAIDTVSVGRFHACALSYDGTVRCWGLALDGRVGSDTSAFETCVADESIAWAIDVPAGTTVPCATRPVLVSEISDATELAVGADHACAVRTGGEVVCWGRGAEGQLGHDRSPESSAVPVTVVRVTDALHVGAGGAHSCAKTSTGTLACWGAHDRGQLGAGSAVTLPCATATLPCRASPIDIALPDTISVPRDLALGERHSCVLTSGGELFCWGEGEGGRLGLGALGDTCDGPYGGPPACRATPQRVDGTFVAIASGHAHTCAIREGGEVDCWGTNDRGQLGGAPGDTSDSPRPVLR